MPINIVLKSGEVKLMESLGAINQPAGWHAIDFHLMHLLEDYKSEYQIKIAVNLVHDLLKDYDGGIFLMNDQSITVLCKGPEKTLQNKLIFQLRYLYMDDPLAYGDQGEENPDFCTSYELERDWQAFWDISSRRMAMTVRKPLQSVPKLESNERLSASLLADLEESIRSADLSKAIRRQPVCAAMPHAPVKRVFDELYIHIAHLRHVLKSEVDFFSNRWLFKYMTQILDERMIELIRQRPQHYLSSPVSFNFNVETLLSSLFADFDAVISPAIKVSVVIEVPVVDVFADMTAFILARKEAQKRGYRVCIDGMTVDGLVNINREKLGADLVKLQWNADLPMDLASSENRDLAAAVSATSANRVILCRCDNQQAIEFGQALGISLFQGRYLDTLVDPSAKLEN